MRGKQRDIDVGNMQKRRVMGREGDGEQSVVWGKRTLLLRGVERGNNQDSRQRGLFWRDWLDGDVERSRRPQTTEGLSGLWVLGSCPVIVMYEELRADGQIKGYGKLLGVGSVSVCGPSLQHNPWGA